jgi:hypothetical protein
MSSHSSSPITPEQVERLEETIKKARLAGLEKNVWKSDEEDSISNDDPSKKTEDQDSEVASISELSSMLNLSNVSKKTTDSEKSQISS